MCYKVINRLYLKWNVLRSILIKNERHDTIKHFIEPLTYSRPYNDTIQYVMDKPTLIHVYKLFQVMTRARARTSMQLCRCRLRIHSDPGNFSSSIYHCWIWDTSLMSTQIWNSNGDGRDPREVVDIFQWARPGHPCMHLWIETSILWISDAHWSVQFWIQSSSTEFPVLMNRIISIAIIPSHRGHPSSYISLKSLKQLNRLIWSANNKC